MAGMPTWVMWGTFTGGIGDLTPGLPSGWQEGDLFLLFVENWPGTAGSPEAGPSAPSGWTSLGTAPNTGTAGSSHDTRLSIFYRRATASESAPTVTDPGDHAAAIIHAFRGVDVSGSPADVIATDSEATQDTSLTYPSVTTTQNDCLIVFAASVGWDQATNTFFNDDLTNSNLTGLDLKSGNVTNQGNGGGVAVGVGGKATAGSTGTTSATCAGATGKALWTIALAPIPATNASSGTVSDSVTANKPSPGVKVSAEGIG